MFKRGQGQNSIGASSGLSGRSPILREPLLQSAQIPGVSQRLSESSLASFEQAGMSQQITANSSFSSGLSNRYGPTASLSTSQSMHASPSQGIIDNSYAGPTGYGDDDLDLDDNLHTFTAKEKQDLTTPFDITSWRGWANAITLAVLASGLLVLFAGYPIFSFYFKDKASSGYSTSGYNLGGINATGQVPVITGFPTLIDTDTPSDVYTRTGFDGNTWSIVFSDEFNKDGRTFYDGDDPYWQAMDLNYWPTGDFEWYDPSAITTKGGHLVITLNQEAIHNLNFKSGMLQSWNKLCFSKNMYMEVSASLPGVSDVGGFWPGVWMMGNLGRAGYGATTDGTWPYSYDSCDIGTLPNQTWVNGTGPEATLTTGSNDGVLSFLPGQRYSACTCAGEDHPGPSNNIGRGTPEIDLLEAQIVLDQGQGQVSQSAQFAPYDDHYQFNNASTVIEQYNTDITGWNTYLGGYYQQAVSSLTMVDQSLYFSQDNGGVSGQFATFGVEYSSDSSDRSNGYVGWISQGLKSWKMNAGAVGPNDRTEVGQRLVTEEPMSIIINLGMSNNFETVDFAHLTFPNYFRIDYIRVYQLSTGEVGCDPADHPTAAFIAKYADIYNNRNLTTWAEANQTFPKNSLTSTC